MKPDTDIDAFLSKVNQLRNELSDLDEVMSTERLTTITLDALPAEKYSTIKIQVIRDPNLSLEEIQSMIKIPYMNNWERSSVTKRSHESSRKGDGRGRESEFSTVVTYHHCKTTEPKIKDCKLLTRKSDMAKSGKLDNGRNKWCKYHRSNGHSNEECYQQKSEAKSGNIHSDRKKVV